MPNRKLVVYVERTEDCDELGYMLYDHRGTAVCVATCNLLQMQPVHLPDYNPHQ